MQYSSSRRTGLGVLLAMACFALGPSACSSSNDVPVTVEPDAALADGGSNPDAVTAPDGSLVTDGNNGPLARATFKPSTANYPNPGRGFYAWSGDDFAESYDPGSVQKAYSAGYRLLLGRVPLNNFRTSDFSAAWLAKLGASFAKMRAAGMKLTMVFSYDFTEGGRDASAAQIKRHLEQLKPVLDANADVIAYMRGGFIGAWGEWHSSKSGNSCGYNAPANVSCATASANQVIVRDALAANVPATTQIGIRYPIDLRRWYPTPGAQKRFGLHNDCFLAGPTDTGTYEDPSLRGYVQALSENAAFGGETCQDAGEAPLRSTCADILREGPLYHVSWLNLEFAPIFIDAWRAGGCFEQVAASMGYRIQLDDIAHVESASAGTSVNFEIELRNVGWARVFGGARKLTVRLKHRATGAVIVGTGGDLQTLASQATAATKLNVAIVIPASAALGDYDVLLSAPDPAPSIAPDPRYAIRFANADAPQGQAWDSGGAAFKTGTTVTVR
jgi:hypothetical protein